MLSELGQESNSTLFIKTNCLQFKLTILRAKKTIKAPVYSLYFILKICLCRVQDNLQTQVCNCIITHVLTIQEKENFPDLEYLKWKSWSLWYAREGHVYLIIYHLKKKRRSTTIRLSLLCNLIRSWSPVGGVTQIIGLCNSATGWTAESHLV